MNTLQKLADKNKTHDMHRNSEHFLTLVMFLVLFPFLFGIAIDIGVIESSENFNLWLYGVGALCFGLPFAAMGDLMIFHRWLKLVGLIIAQIWFVYFWAFKMQSWVAFAPLVVTFLIVRIQASKIRGKAEAEENNT
ncbi:hypothetical protein JK628_20285 [Shewanella sp. KX20019]|uniref:hypothetical protein n=1 Tax=Shewanella sp. KX20019 TaxID=2803864 RepID=UPI0019252F5D|nr:hypothetical protein [Shewanella sp. KX20019]QQX79817.1 hypothetical protein JK628_20285 [Shewanella sp. KX20019]